MAESLFSGSVYIDPTKLSGLSVSAPSTSVYNTGITDTRGGYTTLPEGIYTENTQQAQQPAYDPYAAARQQTISQYQQGIDQTNSAIGRLDGQKNVGYANIKGDYDNNLSRLTKAKNLANQNYTKSKIQTTDDNRLARGDIDFSTGQRINQLQRLLGARGAGRSSAAGFAAPFAASLQGSQQLRQVGDAFTKNIGALNDSWNTYQTNWNQSVEDLNTQKVNAERTLDSDILTKRQSLLSTLAELMANKASAEGGNAVAAAQPYLDQVNALGSQIDSLGSQYFGKVNVGDPTYKEADLSEYDYDKADPAQFKTAGEQSTSPYLFALLNGRKKEGLI